MAAPTTAVRCHYEVLGVPLDADSSTIKKAHRKLALKHHPDKNIGNEAAAEQAFRLVQQAYEVLSDPQERKWYDEHREAILAGWSSSGDGDAAASMLFQVVPYMHPGCYTGYHNEKGGFYHVYKEVFENIVHCERKQTPSSSEGVPVDWPTDFGTSTSDWSLVLTFYQSWESFASQLSFAWEDKYNVLEDAPNRWVRRRMEEENKKARKAAKKVYVQDILALVAFCKKRDPRVKAKQAEMIQQQQQREKERTQAVAARKLENQKAKAAWQEQAQKEWDETEEADRLAGRVRLADLEDDYDYGGGKKKKRGKKNKNKRGKNQGYEEEPLVPGEKEPSAEVPTLDGTDGEGDATPLESAEEALNSVDLEAKNDASPSETVTTEGNENSDTAEDIVQNLPESDQISTSEDEESEEPDIWWCECCRKEFKSEGQMENHMKSKKHKEKFKKYQAKLQKEQEEEDEIALMADLMDELDMESS